MAEWLVEQGIGEERAIEIVGGEIAAARLRWPGGLECGEVADAVLVSHKPPVVRFPSGAEAFCARLPAGLSEGAVVRVAVTREAVAERGRLKRAQAEATDAPRSFAPSLAESLRAEGHEVRVVRAFPAEADWSALFLEAWAGEIAFPDGALLLSDTPAMTLIDVDAVQTDAVARHAVPTLAATVRRLDIGGNIGIDFPTLAVKDARRALDRALDAALAGWPHERTAMNGFGLVQLVARLSRPSILQRIARNRAGAAARFLLRRAEALEGAGAVLLTCHPSVETRLRPEWRDELARRTGRDVLVEANPALALEAGHAQLVPR